MIAEEQIGDGAPLDRAVLPDEKGRPPNTDAEWPIDAERLDDLARRIRQQRERQSVGLSKTSMTRFPLGRNADDPDPHLVEFGAAIAELTRLSGTYRAEVSGIEIHDQRSVREQLGQGAFRALVTLEGEVRLLVAVRFGRARLIDNDGCRTIGP